VPQGNWGLYPEAIYFVKRPEVTREKLFATHSPGKTHDTLNNSAVKENDGAPIRATEISRAKPLGGFVIFGGWIRCVDGAMDRVINFASMDRHFFRRFHAEPHFVAANLDDDNRNVIVDDNTLVLLPR
jgi:hypothetical protein